MKENTFGLLIPSHLPWPRMVETARGLEALGFDSLWLGDHLLSPIGNSEPWFAAWPALAGLATQTDRIRLGTLITTFLLHHPAALAKDITTIDHISGGRLEVGIGAGGYEDLEDAKVLGLPLPRPGERFARFREGVLALDSLLRGEVIESAGRFFQFHEVVTRPPPAQAPRPPLTIAAHGDRALRVAASYADRWNSFMGAGPRDTSEVVAALTRERNAKLDDFARQSGRDPSKIVRSFLAGWTPDRPWTSEAAFVDFVGRYREAGITDFIFPYPPELFAAHMGHPPESVQQGIFERVAHEVLPALRQRGSG